MIIQIMPSGTQNKQALTINLIKDTNIGMIWTTPGYGVLLLSKKEVPWVISHYRY